MHYLHGLGIRTFYVYRALELPSLEWLAANATLRAEGDDLIAQTALVGAAAAAGFAGVYTYDIVVYSGDKFMRLCTQAHKCTSSARRRSGRATTRGVAAATRRSSRAETARPTITCGARRSRRAPTA